MLIVYKLSGEVVYAEPGYPQRIASMRVVSARGVEVGLLESWAVAVLTDTPELNRLVGKTKDDTDWYSGLMYPRDFPGTIANNEYDVAIDAAIGMVISKAVHPSAGIEEQLGILREQIAQMLADFGQQSTKRFQRLQDIAEAEIAKGQKKKDALKE